MKGKIFRLLTSALIISVLWGCASPGEHRRAVTDTSVDRITVGKVQREIRVGMTGAEVAEVLGSPNIVSTDAQRREVWIYDKVSTTSAYSSSSGGVSALILGFGNSLGGDVASGYSEKSGAISSTQRTLTIIIKFDKESRVRDFSYRTSSF